MAYYNQNPPAVNVNVSSPPPGQGYPPPSYQGYPPQPGYSPPAPAPQQVYVTQAPSQAANPGVAETGLMACLAGMCCCCCLEEICCF